MIWFLILFSWSLYGDSSTPSVSQLKLPQGFKISVFASDVAGARQMALGPQGTLFIGSRDEGKVYAIPYAEGKGGKTRVVAEGLSAPNGVAIKNNSLYIAEIGRILRLDDAEGGPQASKPAVVTDKLPKDEHHGWKFIAFSPDGWLYVPVGAPCNVCEKENPQYGTILRVKPGSDTPEIFARGIRNTVGFDWHPKTKELWFTDNGRDLLGDNIPPDELNRAPQGGLHFGFPYCYGKSGVDPEFGKKKDCRSFTKPEFEFGAHVAALGMRFYTGKQFPQEFQNQIFVAQHGSWNRTIPDGYRVMVVKNQGGKLHAEPFVEGWLKDRTVTGRPVDVLVAPDGALLISDDKNGAIYRVTYEP